jgi:ABC-type dipeptide/oligopeptide/nickel transport system permease component
MGVNFIVALVVLLSNLLTDVAYAFVDPRIRYE